MTYFEGFVIAVPTANKDSFRDHAEKFAAVVKDLGVERQVEAWGDDVPHGEVTDFYRAVSAKEDETIVFSWFEYPSKGARDAANEKFRTDPRMQDMSDVPFDGKRMIIGGFDSILDEGSGRGRYVNGFIAPVPNANKQAYLAMNQKHAAIFREYGALRFVQAWGDDVPEGEVTDFRRAVKAEPDETVVFAFIEWPSKETNDAAWDKIMKDERMQPSPDTPFDGKRLFWGGFDLVVDTAAQPAPIQTGAPITA